MSQTRSVPHPRAFALTLGVVMLTAGCAAGGGATEEPPPPAASTPAEDEHGHDHHEMLEVSAEEPPQVRMEVSEDPVSGWNIHLEVEDYEFTPERSGAEPSEGEGHAHLYLDGTKIARVYGPWYHVPAEAVPEGEHTLSVELSANDHSIWAVDGEAIGDSATIEGSGGHAQDHADVTVEITVADGEVSPAPGRVEVQQGQRVRIEVDGDQEDTVHLHGYDIETPLTRDEPAVLTFTAEHTGVFELETHESELLLTQLAVQ